MNVLFASGGTGGHIYPGIALAQELRRRDPETRALFLISGKKVEIEILDRADLRYEATGARMIRRTGRIGNVLFPLYFAASLARTLGILLRFRPSVAVGTGGYASVPPILAAWMLRIPTLIQEQNSYPGLATRLLARIATEVHLAFDQSGKFFGSRRGFFVSGNPARGNLVRTDPAGARKHFGLRPDRKTVFVFGGSQGARAINLAMVEALGELRGKPLQVLWVMGKRNYDEMMRDFPDIARWEKEGFLHCRDYLYEMERAYDAADVVVSRAGALTLTEITLMGLPAILVPLPGAAANHQLHNARALAEQGAALLLEQKDLSGKTLAGEIEGLITDGKRLEEMGRASTESAFPGATGRIADAILHLAAGK